MGPSHNSSPGNRASKFGKFAPIYCSEHLLQLPRTPQPGHGNKGGWSLWKCVFRLCTYPRHCCTVSVQEVELKPCDSSRLGSPVTNPPWSLGTKCSRGTPAHRDSLVLGGAWNSRTTQLHTRTDKGLGAG